MLAVGVDNKPVLFYFILVNPKSNNRQPGPLVSNQRWTSCCCSSWCFYALAWYRHASFLRRHCMTITLRVRGKGEAVEDRYCCCCCWCCCSAITILNSYILPPIIYLTLFNMESRHMRAGDRVWRQQPAWWWLTEGAGCPSS